MKQIQCPHLFSYSPTHRYCLEGKFPFNCEDCDCPDKMIVNITMTSSMASTRSKETVKKAEERKKKRDSREPLMVNIPNNPVDAFAAGVSKGREEAINNACEWIKKNFDGQYEEFLDILLKTMEEDLL